MRTYRMLLGFMLIVWSLPSARAQAQEFARPPLPPKINPERIPGAPGSPGGMPLSQATGRTIIAPTLRVLKGPPRSVESMKLLAPGIGWARAGERLFWTENGGKDWKTITIPTSPDVEDGADASGMYDLFFLDAHQGWAMFAGCGVDNPKKLDFELDLLSTTDSGATWSRTQVTAPTVRDYGNPDGRPIQGCSTNYAFADSLHGWINVTIRGETMNTFWSFLLVTSDGGRTWKQARHAPILEDARMLLITPSEGWLLGSSQEDPYQEPYVSYDGARSWHLVSAQMPKELSPATKASCDLPVFLDNKHGYLLVSYSYSKGGNDIGSEVLFATDDGGRSWKPDRMVTNQEDGSSKYSASTVVDSSWIFVAFSDHHPILTKLGAGERIDGSVAATAGHSSYRAALELSFATPTQGWVVVGDGELLSTTDGGATWTDITPKSDPDESGLHVSP